MHTLITIAVLTVALSQPVEVRSTTKPARDISDDRAIAIVKRLLAGVCGQPSSCTIALDHRGSCPFTFYVTPPRPAEFAETAKLPVLRIGLDRRGALIGVTSAGEFPCASI